MFIVWIIYKMKYVELNQTQNLRHVQSNEWNREVTQTNLCSEFNLWPLLSWHIVELLRPLHLCLYVSPAAYALLYHFLWLKYQHLYFHLFRDLTSSRCQFYMSHSHCAALGFHNTPAEQQITQTAQSSWYNILTPQEPNSSQFSLISEINFSAQAKQIWNSSIFRCRWIQKKPEWDNRKQKNSQQSQSSVPRRTFAHRFTVIPVGVAGIDTLNRPRALLHDEARGAGEGNRGAQLVRDVTAAEIAMRHVRLPAVFVIESFRNTKEVK